MAQKRGLRKGLNTKRDSKPHKIKKYLKAEGEEA
jgi:hypothetical protein